MRKFLFCLLLLIFSFSIIYAQTRAKFSGTASKGGRIVRTSPTVQYKLMETYPACTITVKLAGSSTLASLFLDETGTPKSNPFTSNSVDARFEFYVDAGRYDITFSGTGIISPFTWSDVFIQFGGGGGGSSGVDTFEGRSGTVISQPGDYNWGEIDKTISSLADITTTDAGDLKSGTIPDARFPAVLPAISGQNLTSLNATNITFGTLADARLSTNIPRKNAVNIFTQDNYFLANVGINTSTPRRRLDILEPTTSQFRLSAVDNSVYTDFFVDSGGSLNILPTGNINFNSTGKQVNPLNNYDQNLGQINKKYLSLHAAELVVETLVAQNTIATIGGRIIVAPSNQLIVDLSPAATSISVKYNNLANGDRIYMEGNLSVEFMAVTSGATPITGGFLYNVTRNLDGTGANQWFAGDAMVNTGVAGNGFIDLYSIRGVKSSTQAGPTIVGNVRNSSTYNDWTENWAIGNLNGIFGYGTDIYGAAFGKYATGDTHITVDSVNGYRIFNGLSTVVGQWTNNGFITVGQVSAGLSNIIITPVGLALRSNTTERIRLTGDGSGFLANNLISWDTAGNLTVAGNAKIAGWDITAANIASGGINLTASATPANNKIFIGTGTYNNANTSFYVDGTGKFSLKDKLTWDGTTLSINGNGIFSGSLNAASGTFTGSLSGATGTFSGSLSAATGTFAGSLSAASGTFTGNLTGTNMAITGKVTAGGGAIALDSAGLTITQIDTTTTYTRWVDSGNTSLEIGAFNGDAIIRAHGGASGGISPAGRILFVANSNANDAGLNMNFVASPTTQGISIWPTVSNTAFKGLNICSNIAGCGFTDSTALEINSTTGAFIPPRMTTTQRDALTATNGMVIYNSTTDKLQVRAAGTWTDLH